MPDHRQPPQPPSDYRAQVLLASRNLFQQRLRQLIREAGGGNLAATLDAFSGAVGDAHDLLASANPLEGFDQADHLTASRLTLMGDDDLDVGIRLREITNRLREAGGSALWRSRSLYMSLLQRSTMGPDDNPVGPAAICEGLAAICAQYDGSVDQTFALLDRIEDLLRRGLPPVYHEINELLAKLGVEPAQAQKTSLTPPSRSGDEQARQQGQAIVGEQTRANPLSLLQELLRHRRQPAAAGRFPDAHPASHGSLALDPAATLILEQLLDRLNALDTGSASPPATPPMAEPPSPTPLALKSSDLDLPAGRPEGITLDSMALIFAALFESPELPDAVKVIIGRLQIPLLKLAIADPSLFADSKHPARLLINRIARAAIGLPLKANADHPLCTRIAGVVTAVRGALDAGKATLAPYLKELDVLIGERDQALRQAAAGHVLLVVEHEKAIHAKQAADNWLRASLLRNRSPEIAIFLERYWLRVMTAAAQAGGSDGPRWQQDSATGGELIWSVLPKQSSEERKHMASIASSLVKRLGSALDEIGVSSAERLPFLNRLFDLQTAALRGHGPENALPAGIAPERRGAVRSNAAASATKCMLKAEALQVHYLAPPADQDGASRPAAAAAAAGGWQVGDWLRFCMPDQEQQPLCGLCCWQSPSSASIVLFNPDWGYAVAIPAATLDQQMRTGRAQVVSTIAAFDTAAERALSLLD